MKRTIIGISGKLTSGKSTLANAICEANPDFTRLALADALKDDIAELCDVSREHIEANKGDFRELLQGFGVLMRKLHGEDYWVLRLVDKVYQYNLMNVVVDDVRFPNELAGLRKSADIFMGVRIEISEGEQEKRCTAKFGAPLTWAKLNHQSETALDCEHAEYYIKRGFSLVFQATRPTEEQVGVVLKTLAAKQAVQLLTGGRK